MNAAVRELKEQLSRLREQLPVAEAENERTSKIANQWLGRSARAHERQLTIEAEIRRVEGALALLDRPLTMSETYGTEAKQA